MSPVNTKKTQNLRAAAHLHGVLLPGHRGVSRGGRGHRDVRARNFSRVRGVLRRQEVKLVGAVGVRVVVGVSHADLTKKELVQIKGRPRVKNTQGVRGVSSVFVSATSGRFFLAKPEVKTGWQMAVLEMPPI